MSSARTPVAVLVASLLLPAAAAAQVPSPTGNFYGTVVDEQGRPLPYVTATLAGPGASQAVTTDAKGDFHFLNLSPGAYSVKLELRGFETVRRDLNVALGKNAVFSIKMPVAGAAEAITVSGQAPGADSRKTETGATFGQKELQSIPTTRDPWAILRQVPGILLADMNVGGGIGLEEQSGFVGKGSDFGQNTFNLDGVGITDIFGTTPVYFDFDSLDNIEVATGGSDPSLATPGVTLNLVTRHGTNQLLGSARVLYSGGAGWDYGLEAGGPVWKDRLWLWGAGARNAFRGQNFVTSTSEPVQEKETFDHWNAKLNAQLAPANSLALSYLSSHALGQGVGAGPSRSQPTTWDELLTTSAYRVEDSQVFSTKVFASLNFSYLSFCCGLTPQGGINKQADVLDYVWQNSFEVHKIQRPQHQAGVTASGFFDTGDLRHELKFGFGYKHMQIDSATSLPGDGLVGSEFSVPNPQPPIASISRPARLRYEANYYSTYLGDTIQAENLTLNVGARFDYQQGKNLPSSVSANPIFPGLLPAVQYSGDSGYPITWRQLQPRAGATYAPGGNRKTLLRASYSRFANRLNAEIREINAFASPAYLWYRWKDTNGNHHVEAGEVDFSKFYGFYNVDPNNPGSSVPVNQIAKNLKTPTTDEVIIAVEREILPNLSATLGYTYRSVHNLLFQPLIGASRGGYQYNGNATGTAMASDGFVLNFSEPYYGLTTDPPPNGYEIRNRPDYTQTYNGVELQLIKPLSNGWMLRASFAYNDWQQYVSPGAIVDPNNMAGGSNASGPVVQGVGNKFGTVWINSTWQFNVSGMVLLPLGIETSANFFGRQGFPIVYSVLAWPNDTRHSSPLIQIGRVGAYRLPDVFLLDLHVQRTFRIGPAVTISPVLDCFNVANSHTVLQRDGFVGSYDATQKPEFGQNPNFNAPAELLSNRVIRGGVQIAF